MSKKNIKIESFAWIGESGGIDYGFYLGDADEPIQFATTLKELIRTTLEAYRIPSGGIANYHVEDMQQLVNSLKAAQNLVQHELNRFKDTDND